ncbi:MAG: hypothetical protein LBV68_02735 [Spirochaetaceae bacterium]|jgi:ABC-type glycerol-3-phosphate transport system substrate-binding protein|nr:hypothetical protein [Spirochaetaceae bacterium]
MKKFFLPFVLVLFAVGCSGKNSAVLWTDKPEIVIYAQLYNSSQSKYTIEVKFVESPAERLINTRISPDMVIGSYLNSTKSIDLFQNIDFLFGKNSINKNSFYPELLHLGLVKKEQRLIPISFNLPVIIFKNSNENAMSNDIISDLDELKRLGLEYNEHTNANWARKGFSPLWGRGNDFLFTTAVLFGVDFEEAAGKNSKKDVLNWNEARLDEAIRYIKDWIDLNGGIQAENDFIYKYFFNPSPKLLSEGRIRFAYMKSGNYFILPQNATAGLDFRWLSRGKRLPVTEDTVLFGIPKKSQSKSIAADFARWFFNESTQDLFLENSRDNHLNEIVFGIAGGFSAMRTVSEFVFPKYYHNLLGHIPPADYLVAVPAALPESWKNIKEDVILPYMLAAVNNQGASLVLREKLNEWQALKRDRFR